MSHSFIHAWAVRTIGRQGNDLKQIADSFQIDHPNEDPNLLEEVLQAHEDFQIDEQGRVTLTDAGLQHLPPAGLSPDELDQLEHLGDHEWTHRAKEAG